MTHHSLVVAFDGEHITPRIACHVKHLPAAQRACALWEVRLLPDDQECSCDDPGCGCADGDHGDNHAWIEDIGYECQCQLKADGCWFESMLEDLHWSEVLDFERHEIAVPVRLSGGGYEDPITVRFVKEDEP